MIAEHLAPVRRVILVTVFSLLAVVTQAAAAQQQPAETASCQNCHAGGVPVPEKHLKVKGASIAECMNCHASQAAAKSQPVVARLHRAHAKSGVDCTTCHTYASGKGFGIVGRKGNLAVLDDEQYERVKKAMTNWASSPWLAAKHGSKNISCSGCHQKQLIPDDNETVLNKQCVACHGGYTKVAAVTKAKLKNPNINPHASHLGAEIACTVCHQGHQESKAYCLNCHTNFNMPIPGGAEKSAAASK
jgi:Cytochrome c3/Cytochrome c554 and c-prime